MEKPNNAIDFEPVTAEEAAKVSSPAEQPRVSVEQMDAKFAAPPAAEPKIEEVRKADDILTSLSKASVVEASPAPNQSVEVKKEAPVSKEKKTLSPDEFIDKFGSKEIKRSRRDGVQGVSTASSAALDIYSHQVDKVLKWSSAALVPVLGYIGVTGSAMVASAGGLSSFIAGAGAIGTGISIGIPAVAAGLVGYTGYKMLKTWRAKRAFKKNFGESAEEALGHSF